MNNEPLVWIFKPHLNSAIKMAHLCRVAPTKVREDYVPLFTRPARTLTDEEILQVAEEIPKLPGDWADHIVFARALLKKAGEQ